MGQVISAAFPTIIETVKGCFGLNESVEDLETQVSQLKNQLADLQEKLRNLEGGGKRRRKQEVDSWIAQATKLINDFPTVKQRAIHGPCWNAWEKYRSIDRVKKMSEAVKDAKNDLRNIGELAVVDMGESTIPSQVDENMKALKRQVTQLSSQAQDIETTLMNLEQGGKKKRKLEVKVWLEQVEEIKNEFETSGKTSLENVQTMRDAVRELRDYGKNFGELTVDVDESTIPSLVVSQLSGKTSNDNLEKLYGWLKDDKVSSIGVYGMGGVGKTTLMRHVRNQILQKMSGVKVYWVTVSQDFSIEKLQDDIARTAGLQFDDKNEDHRATILQQHLVGKKTVLILDDVWKFIDLEKLGDPHRIEGCKFIITSRSSEVCRQIGCQNFFKVDVFNEEEAWNLFKQILLLYDHIVVSNAIEEHAKSLAKKCGGLPLALKTVAASMRGVNDDHVWRNAVKNFQNASQLETLENNVFQRLEFSYNRLNDQRLKDCFLYCCLYGEDAEIKRDEIIIKFIAEGLCEDIDEGHSILKKLTDIFLLEEVVGVVVFEKEEHVMMHDLMREMALKISKFLVKFELVEILEEKHWTAELERVSFNSNTLKEIPNDFSPICHKLSTLNLRNPNHWNTSGIKEIPESFLLYMSQLRVLDLSYNEVLKCLPNSISNLENLCGLFLQGCRRISCLPAMKKMKKLRVLNIQGCNGIRELPQDMECLVSLQYLYMMGTSKDLEIPKGVISKLRNLRCIQLEKCGRLVSEELNCLPHLQEFWSWFDELHNFNRLVKNLERLKCYNICVSSSSDFYMENLPLGSNVRKVDFTGINFTLVLIPANITSLHIKHLFICECDSMKKLLPHALLQNLKNLEELCVRYCSQLEVVIGGVGGDGEEEGSSNTPIYLPKLKQLYLHNLPELKSICNGREMICPSIENISIWRCTNVKRMPSFLPINEATEQPYIPSSFRNINLFEDEKEWWESLELHNPNAKYILQSHIEWWD